MSSGFAIIDANGNVVWKIYNADVIDVFSMIVRSVNAHDALVEALEMVDKFFHAGNHLDKCAVNVGTVRGFCTCEMIIDGVVENALNLARGE